MNRTRNLSFADYKLATHIQNTIMTEGPMDKLSAALRHRTTLEMVEHLLERLPDIFTEDENMNLVVGTRVIPLPILYAPKRKDPADADIQDTPLFELESNCFGCSCSCQMNPYSLEEYYLVNAFQLFADGYSFIISDGKLFCTEAIPTSYVKLRRWNIETEASLIAAHLRPKELEQSSWVQNYSIHSTAPEKMILDHIYSFNIVVNIFLNTTEVKLQTELKTKERVFIETILYNETIAGFNKWRIEKAVDCIKQNVVSHILSLEQITYNREITKISMK